MLLWVGQQDGLSFCRGHEQAVSVVMRRRLFIIRDTVEAARSMLLCCFVPLCFLGGPGRYYEWWYVYDMRPIPARSPGYATDMLRTCGSGMPAGCRDQSDRAIVCDESGAFVHPLPS